MQTVLPPPKFQIVTSQTVRTDLELRAAEKSTSALKNHSEGVALEAIALMRRGCVCDLIEEVTRNAAHISYQMDLSPAESIMLATARAKNARLWTEDERLRGIAGISYKTRVRDQLKREL